jgi:hypothetical protein
MDGLPRVQLGDEVIRGFGLREDRRMKIPGMRLIKKAERKGNEVEVPVAENLGLVDFSKLTYKEMNEDHVMAFAGNLTYKGLFAIFPFFTFLLSLLGVFNATLSTSWSTSSPG